MRQKGYIQFLVLIIIVGLIFAISQLFGSKKLNINSIPSPSVTTTNNFTNQPVLTSPTSGSVIKSPLTITGTVPAGWMFEGVFPMKLVDSNKKIIATAQAREVTPGSWQSGKPVAFSATVTFTTKAKTGTLILENDNPSGDPANLKTFEVPVLINCTPRPACLDSNPRCLLPETSDMCPPSR